MWVGAASDTFAEKKSRGRVRAVSVMFAFGYAIIALRLFVLQVVRGGDLAQMSESNRTQVIFLRAPRGDFYDREGRAIVKNRPSWSLMYSVPDKTTLSREELEKRLTPYLAPFPKYWTKRLAYAYESKQMVRLVEDVPDQTAFLMREMEEVFPGMRVVMEFRRGYPMGVTAAHLIGYLGEITDQELRNPAFEGRRRGDLVGKMGLERIHDSVLRGRDGGMLIEVDSIGRLRRIIKELPFQKGGSLHLTLDLDVQRVAEEELAKTPTGRGAVVVLDVNTGAVLAWASAPAFDPMGSMAEDLVDPNHPFLDRVYKAAYPPGSVFKAVVAIAGFETNQIRPSEQVECTGSVSLPNGGNTTRVFHCWKRHGWVDYWRAMAESCDSYFYLLGKKLGPLPISQYAEMFGLGQNAQRMLPGENKGTVPSPAWKHRTGRGGWSMGDTFNMSIGQGYVTATPLQLASLMAGIATRGKVYETYAVDSIDDGHEHTIFKATPVLTHTIDVKPETWDAVSKALGGVVESGTGKVTQIPGLDVRGKTGTAQNPHGQDHAWFAAYAGYEGEKPSVALCVFVENGGHGGVVAGPIAKHILETALPPRTPAPAPKAAS